MFMIHSIYGHGVGAEKAVDFSKLLYKRPPVSERDNSANNNNGRLRSLLCRFFGTIYILLFRAVRGFLKVITAAGTVYYVVDTASCQVSGF